MVAPMVQIVSNFPYYSPQLNMKTFFNEFKKFVLRGNVIDLAIAVVLGTAFNAVVNSLVTNVITPPIGLFVGKINFADLAFNLGGTVKIQYGLFIQALITFLITALALFVLLGIINRIQELAALRKKEESTQPPAPADSPEVSILKEIRDALKARGIVAPESPAAPEPDPIPTIKD